MPNLFKDASLSVTRALPTADGTVTSTDLDIGLNPGEIENVEFVIVVPELTAVNLPAADTLTFTVQTGAAATPTTASGVVFVVTGTGSTIATQDLRFKVSTSFGRYVNVKIVAAGGTGDMSAKSAVISPRF